MKYFILTIMIVVVGVISFSSRLAARYEVTPPELTTKTKEMMSNIYLDPIDPNDTIYGGLAKPLPEWLMAFADSERSRIIFNLTALNAVVMQNQQRIAALEARVKELETRLALLEIESVRQLVDVYDPNNVKEVKYIDPNKAKE